MNVDVNADNKASMAPGYKVSSEASLQQEFDIRYTSDSYQMILDYHVGEILLTTIIFGVIILFRLHH